LVCHCSGAIVLFAVDWLALHDKLGSKWLKALTSPSAYLASIKCGKDCSGSLVGAAIFGLIL
jgi:hypothetical protein